MSRNSPSHTSLFSGNLFLDLIEPVVLPWFREAVLQMSAGRRSVVTVPTHAFAAYLKHVLAQHKVATFGVEFWTTSQLRAYLTENFLPKARVPLREDLDLFARMAALPLDTLTAKAISTDPQAFTRVYGALIRAGHDPKDILNDTSYSDLLPRFSSLVAGIAPDTVEKRDQQLLELSHGDAIAFSNLLICGYHSANWEDLTLLRAALGFCERGTVCLEDGRGDEPSTLWLGTWEEYFDSITPVDTAGPRPFEPVSLAIENGKPLEESEHLPSPLNLLVARSRDREADAITHYILQTLSAQPKARIGAVFASADTLAREVSLRLTANNVEHHDTIGHYPAPSEQIALFEAWTTLQEEPVLATLIDLGRLLVRQNKLDRHEFELIEKQLTDIIRIVATDQLQVIRAYAQDDAELKQSADFIDKWKLITPQGDLSHMLQEIGQVLTQLGMEEATERVQKHFEVAGSVDTTVSRAHMAKWVRDFLKTPGRLRSQTGRNLISRVQLLSLEDAARQEFTHLILCGMTDKQWPPRQIEDAILTDELATRLNKAVIIQGTAGEGSLAVREGHGLLVTRQHHRARYHERFRTLIETVSQEIVCSFRLTGSAKTKDSTGPSEWLLNLMYAWDGTVLDEKLIEQRLKITEESTPLVPTLQDIPSNENAGMGQMIEAFHIRRKADAPFGEYEFSLATPPPRPWVFSCSVWESLITRPGQSWFKHILKVEPLADHRAKQAWALTIGNWTHDWISYRSSTELIDITADTSNLPGTFYKEAAQRDFDRVQQAYRACGREIPDWYQVQYYDALRLTSEFVSHIQELSQGFRLAGSESRLPRMLALEAVPPSPLPLIGKMDLFFCNLPLPRDYDAEAAAHDRGPARVIDFKTGAYKMPTIASLRKGEGLQVVLYMLGLAACGYTDVRMDIIDREGRKENTFSIDEILALKKAGKDVSADDLIPDTAFWECLNEIAERGRLGHNGSMGEDRTRDYFPIATLDIPKRIMVQKWRLTHQSFL